MQIPDFRKTAASSGFTAIEIIAVLVIVGILSAVAVSRLTGHSDAEDLAAANTLKVHLRYAQLRAMGDIVPWGIRFNGDSYTLLKGGEATPVNLPGENNTEKALENLTESPDEIWFEAALGRPDPDGASISVGGRQIFITPETGFIE